LNELVEMKALWSSGQTRGKSYSFADPTRWLLAEAILEIGIDSM
jgi:hypothetical protein